MKPHRGNPLLGQLLSNPDILLIDLLAARVPLFKGGDLPLIPKTWDVTS